MVRYAEAASPFFLPLTVQKTIKETFISYLLYGQGRQNGIPDWRRFPKYAYHVAFPPIHQDQTQERKHLPQNLSESR